MYVFAHFMMLMYICIDSYCFVQDFWLVSNWLLQQCQWEINEDGYSRDGKLVL